MMQGIISDCANPAWVFHILSKVCVNIEHQPYNYNIQHMFGGIGLVSRRGGVCGHLFNDIMAFKVPLSSVFLILLYVVKSH